MPNIGAPEAIADPICKTRSTRQQYLLLPLFCEAIFNLWILKYLTCQVNKLPFAYLLSLTVYDNVSIVNRNFNFVVRS